MLFINLILFIYAQINEDYSFNLEGKSMRTLFIEITKSRKINIVKLTQIIK